MNEDHGLQKDSAAWVFFVQFSWGLAVVANAVGIYHLPTELWVKGFMGMGMLYLMGSSFTLAKTLRDRHESVRLIKRVSEAKTEKMLKEFSQV